MEKAGKYGVVEVVLKQCAMRCGGGKDTDGVGYGITIWVRDFHGRFRSRMANFGGPCFFGFVCRRDWG